MTVHKYRGKSIEEIDTDVEINYELKATEEVYVRETSPHLEKTPEKEIEIRQFSESSEYASPSPIKKNNKIVITR